MAETLISEYSDSSLHLAYAGPFVLMNWRTEFNPSMVERIEALHHRRATHFPAGIIGINVVEPECALPSSEARERGNDMMTRTSDTTRAVVMIMLDQGFAASALQSIALRVIGLGGRVPIRSFRAVRSAAEWIHFEYPDSPEPAALAEIIEGLRREG